MKSVMEHMQNSGLQRRLSIFSSPFLVSSFSPGLNIPQFVSSVNNHVFVTATVLIEKNKSQTGE